MRGIVGVAPLGEFILVVAIDAALAMLVFRHARRRQNRHATAWGVFTFLAVEIAIPVYFLNYWIRQKSNPPHL